jgi:hypothetical protein
MANFVTVTNKEKELKITRPIMALAAICVAVCGGGYTASQTAQAMELQRKVKEKGSATKNKYTITLV